MSYQYSQEAKKRIADLGQAEVAEFIEEIPQRLRKAVYEILPKVQGFRPRSQIEFKEKQRRLVGHLTHLEASQELDWKGFSLLWEAWARERFGGEFPQSDNSEPSLDAGLVFLKNLSDLFPEASREDVGRLFVFSGFPDHPDVFAMLTKFRSSETLMRDRMIDELPGRLEEIESRLGRAEGVVTDTTDRIGMIEEASAVYDKGAEKTSRGISQISSALFELRTALDVESARSGRIEKVINSLDTGGKKIAEAAIATDLRVDALEQGLRELAARGERWDGVSTEVEALKEAVIGLSVREADWAGAAEAVGVLEERLTALERILAGGGAAPGTRLLESKPEGPFVDILSVEGACDVVASNFQAIGVVKGAAIAMARKTVAAFVAGQMVQFTGSLADLAADAVAAAIGGPSYHEWRVPVGLISDEAASDCVETVAESSGCLLLRGANLSAFEVYGAAVRDIVVRRQFAASDYGRLALIASWAQGPASFPDGGTLAELGPVFDTDALPMRGMSAKLPDLKFGHLVQEAWGQVEGFDTDEPTSAIIQLRERLEEAGFEGGSLWKRVANRAYVILRAMPGGTPENDLHSLLVSWAIPWAKAMGAPSEEITRISRELVE